LYQDILFNKYIKGHNNRDFIDNISTLFNDEQLYQNNCLSSKEISEYYSKENIAKQWDEFYHGIVYK
ncbi:MAG: glycosyltransferase, partial [Bacilli bacterium]